jgi:hypothetical protein
MGCLYLIYPIDSVEICETKSYPPSYLALHQGSRFRRVSRECRSSRICFEFERRTNDLLLTMRLVCASLETEKSDVIHNILSSPCTLYSNGTTSLSMHYIYMKGKSSTPLTP